jgi:hypothetical protein
LLARVLSGFGAGRVFYRHGGLRLSKNGQVSQNICAFLLVVEAV